MAKLLLVLFAVCVLPAIASAFVHGDMFLVKGSVFCDTCHCGYETNAIKPVADSIVRIECRSRKTGEITYTKHGVTNSAGCYEIPVHGDRGDDYCDVVPEKSGDPECMKPSQFGRDRTRIILTGNNGMKSSVRFANPVAFDRNEPLASCPQILQQYQEADD